MPLIRTEEISFKYPRDLYVAFEKGDIRSINLILKIISDPNSDICLDKYIIDKIIKIIVDRRKFNLICAMIYGEIEICKNICSQILQYVRLGHLIFYHICDEIIEALVCTNMIHIVKEHLKYKEINVITDIIINNKLSDTSIKEMIITGIVDAVALYNYAMITGLFKIAALVFDLMGDEIILNDHTIIQNLQRKQMHNQKIILKQYARLIRRAIKDPEIIPPVFTIDDVPHLFNFTQDLDHDDIMHILGAVDAKHDHDNSIIPRWLLNSADYGDLIEIFKSYLVADQNGMVVYINEHGNVFKWTLLKFDNVYPERTLLNFGNIYPEQTHINSFVVFVCNIVDRCNQSRYYISNFILETLTPLAILTDMTIRGCKNIIEVSNYHRILPRSLKMAIFIMAKARYDPKSYIYGMPNEILFLIMKAFTV
jgi:hypothetical protein